MPRLYHSPSSIELGRACPRAWYWQYVAGWREPAITWSEIEAGVAHQPRQRSTALGVAMHAQAEAYLTGAPVPYAWESLPGQMFAEGRHHLPDPAACNEVEVEAAIGSVPIVGSDRIQFAREIHDIMWAGFIDYRAIEPSVAECARLGLASSVPVLTLDHKSCSDLGQWAKSRADLEQDAAASVYAIDTCEELGLRVSPQRWVYYESKKIRRSGAVDFTIGYDQALETLAPLADLARELDEIVAIEDAPCNTAACDDFGGRPCHISRGGPCDPPRRSLGAKLVALRKKEKEKVKTSSFAEKFGKAKANVQAQTAESEAVPEAEAAPVEAPAEPKPTRHPRPAKAKAAEPAAPVVPADSTAAKVAAISSRLIEAETKLIAAKAAYESTREAFEAAGAEFTAAQDAHVEILDELRDVVSGTVDVEVEAGS